MIDFESYKQANELTQQGKWSDALKIYQKLLKNDQTNPPNFAFLCVNHVIVNSKYT